MREFEFNDRRITVCEETGAVYIYIKFNPKRQQYRETVFETKELEFEIEDKHSSKMIMADLDCAGNLIGVEIL